MAVKKAIHYHVIQNILQHYECPDTCKAYCCKNGRVHMLEDEFKILTELNHGKAKNIINDSLSPNLYMMNNPCLFLNITDRCDAYTKRPTVCGLYPFKMNNSGFSVGLQPCPLGFMIMTDFSSWVMDTISKTNIPEDEKAEIIMKWQTDLESYAVELSEFHINLILKEMQIPFDELDMLSMFLSSKNTDLKNSSPLIIS
ncbi:YkgJ family cysteine cluster protein [Methanolobus sp. ZRKC3]|uniref:YkgJ family cysteine cluster protein n=1 Tax=Methanolobus sp. ZRKC3 TaxID=3125786 RepID=UPI00324822A2